MYAARTGGLNIEAENHTVMTLIRIMVWFFNGLMFFMDYRGATDTEDTVVQRKHTQALKGRGGLIAVRVFFGWIFLMYPILL